MANITIPKGTTVEELKKKYGVTWAQLKAANPEWIKNAKIKDGVFVGDAWLRGNFTEVAGGGTTGTTGTTTGGTDTSGTLPGTETTTKMAFDIFWNYARLAGYTDQAMIQSIYDASDKYLQAGVQPSDIFDLIAMDKTVPAFNDYLASYNSIKAVVPEITTIGDWNRAKLEYKTLLSNYGLGDLATDANANQFLANGVSVSEAANRMATAYNAIYNADEALKKELATYFPSLQPKDLVATILGVGKTAAELQKEINIAGISAEMKTAGLGNLLNAEELAKQGISRQQARSGFQQTAVEAGAFTAAAERAGISTSGLTQELAQENVAGLASQRRGRIAKAEENLFAGQSGTASVSLGSTKAGKF